MSMTRRAAAAVAALLATFAIAPAASAATAVVTAPVCATSPTDATWTTHYEGGRYELATLALTGLESCAGADLVIGIGSEQQLLTEIPVTVPAGTLTVDVRDRRIPAQQVDQIALTLRTTVASEPVTEGTATDDATGTTTVDAPVAPTPLPSTGTNAAWFAALAAALFFLGAALRRRARSSEEAHRA